MKVIAFLLCMFTLGPISDNTQARIDINYFVELGKFGFCSCMILAHRYEDISRATLPTAPELSKLYSAPERNYIDQEHWNLLLRHISCETSLVPSQYIHDRHKYLIVFDLKITCTIRSYTYKDIQYPEQQQTHTIFIYDNVLRRYSAELEKKLPTPVSNEDHNKFTKNCALATYSHVRNQISANVVNNVLHSTLSGNSVYQQAIEVNRNISNEVDISKILHSTILNLFTCEHIALHKAFDRILLHFYIMYLSSILPTKTLNAIREVYSKIKYKTEKQRYCAANPPSCTGVIGIAAPFHEDDMCDIEYYANLGFLTASGSQSSLVITKAFQALMPTPAATE